MTRRVGICSVGFAAVSRLFSFPDPVNETSARVVAAGVLLEAALFFVVRDGWALVPLVYGFAARVLTGPTLSPLGQLATRVVTPRLHVKHRFVPGPPKRFAQGMTANNTDSVEEFRVITEGGKAEYGRNAGGQIELITRSGTNQYHGIASRTSTRPARTLPVAPSASASGPSRVSLASSGR